MKKIRGKDQLVVFSDAPTFPAVYLFLSLETIEMTQYLHYHLSRNFRHQNIVVHKVINKLNSHLHLALFIYLSHIHSLPLKIQMKFLFSVVTSTKNYPSLCDILAGSNFEGNSNNSYLSSEPKEKK